MKRGAGIIVLLVLGQGLPGHAAEGALRSEVDARKIGLQDQVQLTITVEGSLQSSFARDLLDGSITI